MININCATGSVKITKPKSIASEHILYEAVINCVSRDDASFEIVNAVSLGCLMYNMTGILDTYSITQYYCDADNRIYTYRFNYKCRAMTDAEYMESLKVPEE